jgi:hypothetical protein
MSSHSPSLEFADLLAEAATRVPDKPGPAPQRDDKGRFVKGNRGGPGNPFARQVAKLRAALIQRVTEADIERIADDLLISARAGHLPSIRLLFLYVLGKPATVVDPDTLDIEEWKRHLQPLPQIMAELEQALMSMPVQAATDMVRTSQPFMQQLMSEELTAQPPLRDHEDGEEVPDDPPDEPQTGATANGRAQPSPNGVRRPMAAVPSWLDKIACYARMASIRPTMKRPGRPKMKRPGSAGERSGFNGDASPARSGSKDT